MSQGYFAFMDNSNVVAGVTVLDVATEAQGIAATRAIVGNPNAIVAETFDPATDAATRYNYATIGGIWDDTNSAFVNIKPYASWTLNADYKWEAPIATPTANDVGGVYVVSEWDEDKQQWNGLNTNTNIIEYVWNPNTLAWDLII